jgi:glutamate mutase epsilon subunit
MKMINFKDMPMHARIWIYPSSRSFSENEIMALKTKTERFISQWTSHGKTMSACIETVHNRFIIVCVDETTVSASGCGIDKSVKFIQHLEKEFKVSLLDRMKVAYTKKSTDPSLKEEIKVCSISEINKLGIFPYTQIGLNVFNNLVNTKKELEENWQVPLKKSWQYEKWK